jgi:hypothetical protein
MTALRLSSAAFLLALCGAATAQVAPAAAQPPVAQQASATAPQALTAKAAVAAAPAASLSPQQQRYLDEANQLVDLAQKLKVEVDKTDQYTLSLKMLQRADDIEKLAKSLQKQIQR